MLEWVWAERNGISFITIPDWCEQGVDIAFTGRGNGVSGAPFESLNLGFHVGDRPELVLENRHRVMQIFNQDIDSMVCCQQVHGNNVFHVTNKNKGCGGSEMNTWITGTDGMVTNQAGLYLATFYADCIPVYFFDPVKKCIGLAHSGWKGTMGRIAVKTVNLLEREFGCKRADIEVFIGPGIGPCCFEIKGDLAAKAVSEFGQFRDIIIKEKNDRYRWNLPQTINYMLVESGIKPENIVPANLCTSCHTDLFYSYRREGTVTGRMGAYLGIRN
jgi:YfiH family protein